MKRRLLAIAGTIALFAGLAVAVNAAVPASAGTHPSVSHTLPAAVRQTMDRLHLKYVTYYYWPESGVNGGNLGYVVDDTGNGGNGTQQQIWTPNGNSQQGWYITCFQSDCAYYWIINENGKCIDDTLGGSANGTKVQVWTCISGDTNQAWYYNKYQGSNGAFVLWLNYNGACLNDQHPYTDGGKIQMWQCEFPPNDHNSETWQVPAATW